MNRAIDHLLRHQDLWRAADGLAGERGTVPTGFQTLDAELAGGGWPMDGLTEILGDTPGVGELRLLLPALARLSRRRARWIALIAPAWLPYAPALAAAGVDVSRVLLVHPKNHQEQLWATEQALKSGTCSAVLSWPDPHHLRHADLRRLQLAAREGDAWGVLFRPEAAADTASPAELRLLLQAGSGDPERLGLRVLKRRGGWPTDDLEVCFEDPLTRRLAGAGQTAALRQLALWRPEHGAEAARDEAGPPLRLSALPRRAGSAGHAGHAGQAGRALRH
jgi:cell division inhibitor SulA